MVCRTGLRLALVVCNGQGDIVSARVEEVMADDGSRPILYVLAIVAEQSFGAAVTEVPFIGDGNALVPRGTQRTCGSAMGLRLPW